MGSFVIFFFRFRRREVITPLPTQYGYNHLCGGSESPRKSTGRGGGFEDTAKSPGFLVCLCPWCYSVSLEIALVIIIIKIFSDTNLKLSPNPHKFKLAFKIVILLKFREQCFNRVY